ncbi:diguanylate cyclase [Desulfurivibrio sp. C05AmB]|uniref:diguanylate cyclase n=1 Tax=Desulfurivibrio sp. C05AmB TaxID=3374371 RepID=UPI00376F19BA
MSQKLKILVVDDDLNLRKTLADILQIKGYEAVMTANGAEAVAAAEREEFSLALIDLMLPDMDGLEVMARIKAMAPLTEAIILTGYASIDTAIEATGQGAFSYLLKPYQVGDLLLKIKRGIERHQAQEEIMRLASFPELHPSPVIEVDCAGKVTYANPAAEKLFPGLVSQGWSHPLLHGLAEFVALRQSRQQTHAISEVEVGPAIYELHTHYIKRLELLRVYARDITQRKLAEKEIYLLATTDSLTGLINRREFAAILARELERAKRYDTPLALAMYDLDFFKRVNDTFGHDVGDYVLQEVAGLVKKNLRRVDVVARWGGEEFMVLMPETSLATAGGVTEKLRQIIAGHHFANVGKLTASFGVTVFDPQDDLDGLLKRVDDLLYRAKEQGRNRVEIQAPGR